MVLQLAFGIVLLIIILPTYHRASAQDYSDPIRVKDGCNSTCGGVYISYPFGMEDPKCYVNGWFEIECRETSEGQKAYMKSLNLEVISIILTQGLVYIMNPIFHWNCRSKETKQAIINLRGSPFVYSQSRNKFLAVGCNKLAFLQSNGTNVGGCVSICGGSEDARDTNTINMVYTSNNDDGCRGRYCCETSLPSYLLEYNATLQDFKNDNSSSSSSSVSGECSSAAIVDENWPQELYTLRVSDLNGMDYVPAVMEWEIWEMLANHTIQLYSASNCFNLTNSLKQYNGWQCDCPIGFAGNPFLSDGCAAIPSYKNNRVKIIIGILSSLGSIIFPLGLWLLYKVVRKIIIKKRKQKFFKKNGGLLLQQRVSSNKVNADKDILFSLDDLEKATDHFNKNRVLGRGGQGTVYKGMLVNGRIVAVKKFKVEGNVEEFINEFIILSQINNRNVVKLLGCCLETKIPLLVYEFIPNGNLFEYLHNQSEELPITWDMRLRIAMEIAGALFYLHSVASKPIFHRDIKSTNILLDEKYRAKIADFGASRIISIEDTHLTTMVQGTFGYLDPEYFRSSQFTEKSDVYSFGVVLVELLTCQKPIFVVEYEGYKSLASYFVECIEKDNLLDIIDKRVVNEAKNGQIIAVANLAKRCLELNGRKRPTMKELTFELERIQILEKNSNTEQNHKKVKLAITEDHQLW